MSGPTLYGWRSSARPGDTTTHHVWPERAFRPLRILAWRPSPVAELVGLSIGNKPQLLVPLKLAALTRALMPPLDQLLKRSQMTGSGEIAFCLRDMPGSFVDWMRAVSFELDMMAASPRASIELVVRGHVDAIALLGEELV